MSENGALWNIHFASDFAEPNPSCVCGLNLLPTL
jgi:hypothetical protein